MNYYDEEITIQTAGVKPHNHAKIERIPSRGSNSGRGNQKGSSDVLIPQHSAGISMVNRTTGQRDAVSDKLYSSRFSRKILFH